MPHLTPMKTVFLFALFFVLSSCGSVKKTLLHVDEVIATEKARFALTVAGDTATLRAYIHPNLLYIHSNGLEEGLQGHLTNVGGGKIDYQSFTSLQPTKARIESKNALVDGLVAVAGLYDGYDFRVKLRYTAVYRKDKKQDQWQLLRWQSTKIEED